VKRKKFIRKSKFFVYILQCQDGTYYTGYTPDLKNRLKLHNKGKGAKYTRNRRPVKLVWYKEYCYFKRAFKKESAIKKLSRKQKEKLMIKAPNYFSRKKVSNDTGIDKG
jgi:putative endonuclease